MSTSGRPPTGNRDGKSGRRRRARAEPRNEEARRRRRRHLWLGWIFIVLGVLGIFLPILQGILFLVIGLLVLGRVSPRVRLWRWRMRRRFPWWARQYDKVEARAREWLARRKSLRLDRRRRRSARLMARRIVRMKRDHDLARRARVRRDARKARKRGKPG